MGIIEEIMESSKLSGSVIEDEKEYARIVEYQLINDLFTFIDHKGKTIGFFGWLLHKTDEGTNVAINNLFILKPFKNKFNLCSLRTFFKNKYPDLIKIEWHRHKKDKFETYLIKGEKNEQS